MTDREKVIRAMMYCVGDIKEVDENDECRGDICPYKIYADVDGYSCCQDHMIRDALALLKEQEPRVMTLEEVKQHDNQDGCVWFEQPTYNAVAAFVRQDEECTEIISPYLLGEPINHGYMSNTFYAKAWRAWTSRPTEEQRKAVSWEPPKEPWYQADGWCEANGKALEQELPKEE